MEKEELERMVRAGMTIADIARRVGRHTTTVTYWLKRYGIEGAGRVRNRPRGSIRREELAALVTEDLTVRDIAERLDRSYSTVRYWLKRYDLTTSAKARSGFGQKAAERVTLNCVRHGEVEHVVRESGPTCMRCRSESVTEWRRRAKRILVEEDGGACRLCGYDRCLAALEFHHLDPATKRFGLGSRGLARALDALREEAAKCVLLCSNCHAEVEAGVSRLPFSGAIPCPG